MPITFALIGPGTIADFHARAIAANHDRGARLGAVVHHNPARFAECSARYGVPCMAYAEALARPEIDAVILCTPSGLHAAQAVEAARARKHVLVEKPMALTLDDADRMIEACAQEGVKLGVVLQRRAEPTFRRIRAALSIGDLGDLTLGVVTLPYYRPQAYYDSAAWRGTWELDGGGILMNQGIHLIDLLVWYFGDPKEVAAFATTRHRNVDVEDVAAAALRFESGAMATITATSTAEPGFPHRLEIYGTQGGIQIEGERIIRVEMADPVRTAGSPLAAEGAEAAGGAGASPTAIPLSGHTHILAEFLDAIAQDASPIVDGYEGRRSLAAVLAIYKAAGLR